MLYGDISARLGSDAVIVEDFEDSSPLGEYSGSTGGWSIVNSPVYEGSNAAATSEDYKRIYDTDHANSPSQGETFSVRHRSDTGGNGNYHMLWVMFGVQSSNTYYQVRAGYDSVGLQLYRWDSGSSNWLAGNSTSVHSINEWNYFDVTWDDGTLGGSQGDITVDGYDSADNAVVSISANDTNYASGGIGYEANVDTNNSGTLYTDYYIK